MRGLRLFRIMLLGTLAGLSPGSVAAQWQPNGAPVCTVPGYQYFPYIVSDGAGGVIVTWFDGLDERDFTSNGFFAQRLSAAGVRQWSPEGVPLVTGVRIIAPSPTIASDGAGGAIVTWPDIHAGNSNFDCRIYAQRVGAEGMTRWTPNGVALSTPVGYQVHPALVADGGGGAIVAWEDERNGQLNRDIYAQRVDAAGVPQWVPEGVAVCAAASFQKDPTIASDGAGGAIIAWTDSRRSGECDIYAQRVDAAGVPLWTADGVPLCTAIHCQNEPSIASDGAGGAIVTWSDPRAAAGDDIYAQRINAAGVPQWEPDGVALCVATRQQQHPVIIPDGAGGAIVTWEDSRTRNADIHAQRVNAAGIPQWTADGVAVCTAVGQQYVPTLVSDGTGGAIVTWSDRRNIPSGIYAQRVNAAGVPDWTVDGVALCAGVNAGAPAIAADGAGGAIVAWSDERAGRSLSDIYAQRVTSAGVVAPAPPRLATAAESLAAALAPALAPRAVTVTKPLRLWNRGESPLIFAAHAEIGVAPEVREPGARDARRAHDEDRPAGWLAVEPASGTIAAGDSLDLLVRFDATGVGDGDYEGMVAVSSNDPLTPAVRIPCRLHVGLLELKLDVKPHRLRGEKERGERAQWESDDVEQARAERDGKVRARVYLPPGVDRRALVRDSVRLQRVLAPLGVVDEEDDDEAGSEAIAENMRGPDDRRDRDKEKPRSRSVLFRFDREALLALLSESGKAAVELSGVLDGISWFAGVDVVEVVGRHHGAAEPAGLQSLRVLPARDGLRLLGRNPLSGAARIELALAAPAVLRVRVYDVGGAVVRELARGDWDAGIHTLTWDGRTASGAAAPSGIYFVRLQGAHEPGTLRLIMAR